MSFLTKVIQYRTVIKSLFGIPISVKDFGAVGDGVADDTAAIQAALALGKNVYLPGGTYKITDMIAITGNQKLYGDGRTESILYVDADFNMSASAVVQFQYLTTGAMDDVGIEFYQDTTITDRANLIQYPWAVKANTAPMCRIGNIRLSRAYNGIWLAGNSGGVYIGRIELGCLNKSFLVDGAMDFVHIESLHHWPFGFTGTNLYTSVFLDGNSTAFECGTCDGLAVDKLAVFSGKVKFITSTESYIPKIINTLQLDGDHSTFENDADFVQISKVYSTKTVAQINPSLKINAGLVMIGSYHHRGSRAAGTVDVTVTGGELQISSGHSANVSVGAGGFKVESGTLDLTNIKLGFAVSARTVPYIEQTGGVLKIIDCDAPAGGSGLGNVISVSTDSASNKIQNNNFSDWGVVLPSSATLGIYGPNRTGPTTYTPTVTFATPGDFSPTYTIQYGRMWREANGVRFEQRLIFSCNSYTTAAGDLIISGPPVTFKGLDTVGELTTQCYSIIDLSASRTQLGAVKQLATNTFKLSQSGDNLGRSNIGTSNIVPGAASVEIVLAGYIPTI